MRIRLALLAITLLGARCPTEAEYHRYYLNYAARATCRWWDRYDICVCSDKRSWAFYAPNKACREEFLSMEESVKLDEFIKGLHLRVEEFKSYWEASNEKDPASYPDALSLGEWDDQFDAWGKFPPPEEEP